MNKGVLVILSGPSGCGKGTVRHLLFEHHPDALAFSVSCTTRNPRPGETDGVDYHFITQEAFDQMIGENGFLEYARFVGKSYGTPLEPILYWIEKGINPILEIEVQGALQVKEKMPECVSVFLLPPSMEELASRLRGRGTEPEEVIAGRLSRAEEEMKLASQYDYQVINDDPLRAAEEIYAIIKNETEKRGENGI